MKVLTFSTLFPNSVQPNHAVFVKHRMAAVHRSGDVDLRVVAPIPFFPRLPFRVSGKWQTFAQVPRNEIIDGIPVSHPRYFVTPKVGMTLYGHSMFLGAVREVARIHKEFPFDVIDGHYIYPDGLAAVLLGRVFGKPVILSARGTDINFFPRFRLIQPLIRRTLEQADHLISVCGSLRDLMVENGASSDKVTVIPNGIDPTIFKPMDSQMVRRRLGLDLGEKVLVTVGRLDENKGMHILIDALAEIQLQGKLNFKCFVIGKGGEKDRLINAIHSHGLKDRVRLIGEVKNSDLPMWYNAADLSFLGSRREGWPNVISESLACGTPVVATSVNGIPEILVSEDLGLIVDRSRTAFAEGIVKGFEKNWNREKILTYGQSRPWSAVAGEVRKTFQRVLACQQAVGVPVA